MKFTLAVTGLCLGAVVMLAQNDQLRPLPLESQRKLVDQYCSGCHNEDTQSGGFSWADVNLQRPERSAERVEKVIRKVRVGMMPPAGAPRPDRAMLKAFVRALEDRIDQAASSNPTVGAPELHRMNRTEYRNAVRELLALEIDAATLLPPDSATEGFDNMADVLTVTPALMQAYIRAAGVISRTAIGQVEAIPAVNSYMVSPAANQNVHVEGTPLGTRGGLSVLHYFPADGDYTFEVLTGVTGRLLQDSLKNQQIELSLDGARLGFYTIVDTVSSPQLRAAPKFKTPPVHIKAGAHRVSAAFLARFDGPVEDRVRLYEGNNAGGPNTAGMTAMPTLNGVVMTGPTNVTGVSDTPARRKIFGCRPSTPAEETPCATRIVTELTKHAFRRTATPEDLEGLMELYKTGQSEKGFENGIRLALQGILAAPEFVFRFEEVPSGVASGQNYRIGDLELASRLSFFLWSSLPDDELIDLAGRGKLQDPAVLEQQVRRMLADSRSKALASNFGAQWLRLRELSEMAPDDAMFPDYSKNLADSMQRETQLLIESVMREDRDVAELLTANYTFVDDRLAKHYRIPNVAGSRFRRVAITDPNRFGILGQASILTLTSPPARTSPVSRGKYVLETLLGTPPPKPPAVVPPLKNNEVNEKPLSVRERIEQHRADPACSSCHQLMDPIGLALENFDAIGVWRTKDSGAPIDASSQLYDGTKVNGPASLREALMNYRDAYYANFGEKLLAYGVGRILDYRDMPAVRSIQRDAGKNNNRFSSFVLAVVNSTPFRMRKTDEGSNF